MLTVLVPPKAPGIGAQRSKSPAKENVTMNDNEFANLGCYVVVIIGCIVLIVAVLQLAKLLPGW